MQRFLSATALATLAMLLVAPRAQAAPCDGSSDPCAVDLGRASAHFANGVASYFAEAVLVQGSDAYYSASPQFLNTLQVSHTTGSDAFTFQPQIYAGVGGSGINGLHEVTGLLQFTGLSFTAQPGYQIRSVQVTLTGTFSLVGDGYGGLGVPGVPQWSGQNFTATWQVAPTAADMQASFDITGSYLAGDDGTALSYGAGSATFDRLQFVVAVAPVPEPAPWALFAAGALLLPWLARRRMPR